MKVRKLLLPALVLLGALLFISCSDDSSLEGKLEITLDLSERPSTIYIYSLQDTSNPVLTIATPTYEPTLKTTLLVGNYRISEVKSSTSGVAFQIRQNKTSKVSYTDGKWLVD